MYVALVVHVDCRRTHRCCHAEFRGSSQIWYVAVFRLPSYNVNYRRWHAEYEGRETLKMKNYDEILRINQSLQNLSDSLQRCIEPYIAPSNTTILSIRQSIEPIQNILSEQAKFNIENLVPSFVYMQQHLQETCRILSPMADYNSYFSDMFARFSALMPQTSFSKIAESLLAEISSQITSESLRSAIESAQVIERCVIISEESAKLIGESFELPENSKTYITPENKKARQFDLREFLITLLLQLLIAALPMMQSHYYRKLDELSAKQSTIEASKYQEELLRLTSKYNEQMEQMNATLNEMLDYIQTLESSQSDQSSFEECSCHTDKVPEHPFVEPQSDSKYAGASDNHAEWSTPD